MNDVNAKAEKEQFEVKICKLCGGKFKFFQGEKDFYAEKGFEEPKKCKRCRVTEKIVKAEIERQMSKVSK